MPKNGKDVACRELDEPKWDMPMNGVQRCISPRAATAATMAAKDAHGHVYLYRLVLRETTLDVAHATTTLLLRVG